MVTSQNNENRLYMLLSLLLPPTKHVSPAFLLLPSGSGCCVSWSSYALKCPSTTPPAFGGERRAHLPVGKELDAPPSERSRAPCPLKAICLQSLKTKSNGFQSLGTFTADYSLKCSFENLIVTVVLILIGCRLRFLGGKQI